MAYSADQMRITNAVDTRHPIVVGGRSYYALHAPGEAASWWFDANTFESVCDPRLPSVPYDPYKAADRAQTISRCYFIGGDVGAIKIGHSVSPKDRLKAIQSCSPIPLRILALASGGEARESAYHAQFHDHRLHGEWFERHPVILAEIERLSPLPTLSPRRRG